MFVGFLTFASMYLFPYQYMFVVVYVAADGWRGLFGRGLRTRVLANSLQSIVFTVIWRGLAERWGNKENKTSEEKNDNPSAAIKHTARKPTKTMGETVEEK